ncbi:MAG: ABC transporter permease [Alphaproteobacteria bacterium]|nr:ABC transporter permease [Alphaproteobacteria bacterium SS10]
MKLLLRIALRQLLDRKRQSLVSLAGIVLGVAFFLAIASLMQGSENDFVKRLIDNSPHISVSDEFRNPHPQPVETRYPDAVIQVHSVKPQFEIRGIRHHERMVDFLNGQESVEAASVLLGQALISFAGRDVSITLNGMHPEDVTTVTTIQDYMIDGGIEELIINPDGLIVGAELLHKLALSIGENVTVATTTGELKTFKIVGVFRTGRASYDEQQVFADLKRVQALLDRPNRANSVIVKMDDPNEALSLASQIEAEYGYKSVSWQESSEDILSTFVVRNIIMYTVVSAVLIVAAFGIYNVISTVVLEKHRDIAILKSMGFRAGDIRSVFLIQGLILGAIGNMIGIPLGCLFMLALGQVEINPPGATDPINLPLDWSWPQFAIAASFAMLAALFAAFLPARKAAQVHPVDILRGGL